MPEPGDRTHPYRNHPGLARLSEGEVRHLLVKALFLSFLVHLIVLSAFVFTFPVFSESFRPTFVFLGAILKSQDVRGDFAGNEEPKEEVVPRQELLKNGAEGLLVQSEAARVRPFFQEGAGKPLFPPALNAQEKATLKTFFEVSAPDDPSVTDAGRDGLGDYGVDAYKPLRLPRR